MSAEEFGSTTISQRELRTLLMAAAAAIALLLLFGAGLAIRLRSSSELNEEPTVLTAEGPESGVPDALETFQDRREDVEEDAAAQRSSIAAEPLRSQDRSLTASETGTPRFGVRVGIFGVPENADRMLLLLQSQGHAAFVVFKRTGEGTVRYVYAGTTRTEAEADALAATLSRELGLSTYIEPVEGVR